jgi:hypothetical protein
MPLYTDATTNVANWDFNQFHVQAELVGGDFISAESTLIAAGPPELAMTGVSTFSDEEERNFDGDGEAVYPIGVLESFGITQARQTQKLFEIGSSRAYFVPGKTVGSIAVARAMYNGPSLMKILYAYYRQNKAGYPNFNHEDVDATIHKSTDIPSPNRALLTGVYQRDLVAIKTNPGYGNLFLNIASELFNQPTGIMMYMRNSMDIDFGAVYAEQVYITGHQMSINAGVNVIMESVSMEFERIVPVEVSLRPYNTAVLANSQRLT